SGLVNTATVQFTFSATGTPAKTFICKLDSVVTDEDCNSPRVYSPGDGDHTFEVAAVDEFGNQDAFKSAAFTIDTKAPTTTIEDGPAEGSTTNDSTPTFSFSASEQPVYDFACKVDDGNYMLGCVSPFTTETLA